ncbi:putative glycosyltransferase EpsJ [termite gut metagenome]|uniref:Putative glycosyltransferase EpsJ n=1 Tax=termite gut metagenome TaxID=433724 RepID=A0A5J4PXN8_9ZZZZ
MNQYFVSIICPIYNEEKYIVQCIESILAQKYPLGEMELLFIDGRSTDNTRDIISDYQSKYSLIKLLDNPNKIVPHALNIGIREAQGNVIIRVDGHCVYPHNYISTLVKYLFELHADNVGAVWNTLPANDSAKCRSIAIASSHRFGVGNSKYKIGAKEIIETDTVPFGCYRRDIFEQIGFFDEKLIRNQDDEFNGRIIKHGGKIFLIPSLIIEYYARDTLKKINKMYYQYGLFKPLANKKLGKPATIRQFVPALFLSSLLLGAMLSFFSPGLMIIYLSIIAAYLIAGIAIGIQKAKQQKDYKLMYHLPFTFFVIHISYGWGYWVGIYKVICKQNIIVKDNR